jgi:hypothetical protein
MVSLSIKKIISGKTVIKELSLDRTFYPPYFTLDFTFNMNQIDVDPYYELFKILMLQLFSLFKTALQGRRKSCIYIYIRQLI